MRPTRDEAEREARRAFGNVTRVKDAVRDVRWLESLLGDVASDVRLALRGLVQKPGFAIAVILTLGSQTTGSVESYAAYDDGQAVLSTLGS